MNGYANVTGKYGTAIGFSSFGFINPDALTRTVITEKYKFKNRFVGGGFSSMSLTGYLNHPNSTSGVYNTAVGNQSFIGGGYKIISGSYLKV
jgi:hypothetical protein